MKPCAGDPPGACVVMIPDERTWCYGCTARRQRAIAQGIPVGLPTPVGIILEDFEAPILLCQCGGVADSTKHEQSLLHRKWAWAITNRSEVSRRSTSHDPRTD